MKTLTTIAILVFMTISTAFGANKNIDQSLVGNWTQQSTTSSSGYGDYASYTSVTYYQFQANGTLCITDGGAVSGGNDWSYNSNGGGNVQCCNWYVSNGYIYFEQNGQQLGYVKYTFHNGQLVLGTKGNYVFLYAAN